MTGKQTRERQEAKLTLDTLWGRAMEVIRRVELEQWSELIEDSENIVFAAASARSAIGTLEQALDVFGFSNSLNETTWVKCVANFRETHGCNQDVAIAVILVLGGKLASQAQDLIEQAEQCLNGERTISGEPALISA
jgi:hypothetical protein